MNIKLSIGAVIILSACSSTETKVSEWKTLKSGENETHLSNLKQLTFGGDNAEAYWSFDIKNLPFKAIPAWGLECDQIFSADVEAFKQDSFKPTLISTGTGRTTCSTFYPIINMCYLQVHI